MCHKVALKESPAAFPLRYALAKKARAVFILSKKRLLSDDKWCIIYRLCVDGEVAAPCIRNPLYGVERLSRRGLWKAARRKGC